MFKMKLKFVTRVETEFYFLTGICVTRVYERVEQTLLLSKRYLKQNNHKVPLCFTFEITTNYPIYFFIHCTSIGTVGVRVFKFIT